MSRKRTVLAVVSLLVVLGMAVGWMMGILFRPSFILTTPGEKKVTTPGKKKVLAFYYGWYGNPRVSGRWVHWSEVDTENHRIGNSTHYPQLGPYDSHDPRVVEQHCRWAKEAGLDGFIVSWWRPNDFHDHGIPLLLDLAQKFGLEITVYLETVPASKREALQHYVLYLLQRYGQHPAWLKVEGKSVLFIYSRALGQIGLDSWRWVIEEANRQYSDGALFIADCPREEALQVFDGIHTYNITGALQRRSPEEIRAWARERFALAQKVPLNRISCLTLIPGFDDSKLSRSGPRPITDRYGGQTYRILWEEAIRANPDWVLITSWNEWHEGSEIEPSLENGDRELRSTAEFAQRFKALPSRRPH